MSSLDELKKAKAFSDARQYEQKHLIMRKLIQGAPSDFEIDSSNSAIVGITHVPTGFQMHLPKSVVDGLNLSHKKATMKVPVAGRGLAKIRGGGKGSYQRMNGLASQAKADLTNATKQVGEDAMAKTPWEQAFPATAEYHKKKMKQAAFSADFSKYLGYSPGVWYGDDVEGKNRMRFGNAVSGVGLAGLGLAAVPVLKYLFPERFEGKDTALNIAAVAGGLALPWAVNFPHTFSELNSLGMTSNEEYDASKSDKFVDGFRSKAYKISSDVASEESIKEAFLPLGTPISKMHLADVAAEQFQSGFIDYGQAAGLMMAAQQSSSKPWLTVGDLARGAIGAGAGAIAGTAAAKGIGMFMNMSPTEQKIMQGTGAALGTLINLGKLGI